MGKQLFLSMGESEITHCISISCTNKGEAKELRQPGLLSSHLRVYLEFPQPFPQ
jgi:hypothetical protein